MRITFKYFYEETDASNTLWESSLSRILFLYDHLSDEEQLQNMQQNMTREKDILAIRFPTVQFIKNNLWIQAILLGSGIPYENTSWKPKEVWIHGRL